MKKTEQSSSKTNAGSGSRVVHHLDAKSLGYCNRGMRRWFERHGLDFNRFRVHGMDEREFLDTGDPMAERLVMHARERSVCAKIARTEKEMIHG